MKGCVTNMYLFFLFLSIFLSNITHWASYLVMSKLSKRGVIRVSTVLLGVIIIRLSS